MHFTVTEHFTKTARHGSFYLASGPEPGPLIIFVHGWPARSHSWRHQLRCSAARARNGFFGPNSWYMNAAANIAYEIASRFAEPMRRGCADLTEIVVPSGHWVAQERPAEVNAALAKWLAVKVPDASPA